VEISVGDFFHVEGNLGFETSTRDLTLEDGSVVSHEVLTVGGSNLNAFAGVGRGSDQPMGFELSGVDFAVVMAVEREAVRVVEENRLASGWRLQPIAATLKTARSSCRTMTVSAGRS
jgi:hypothetical protein